MSDLSLVHSLRGLKRGVWYLLALAAAEDYWRYKTYKLVLNI
jgi:hypothetical protein